MSNYNMYNSSYTIPYKQGRIYCAYFGSREVVKVTVDQWAYLIEVKSIHAAKLLITKHSNKYGGEKLNS